MTFADVITAIEEMNCRIDGGAKPAIHKPKDVRFRKRFEEMIPWLAHYRMEILAHYEPPAPRQLCPLCSRDVTDAEDRERLAGVNPWCEQGEAPPVYRDGKMVRKKIAGCPYRGTS